MYDFANSSFSAIIITFVFSTYFARQIVGDVQLGAAYWQWTTGVCGLLIAKQNYETIAGFILDTLQRIPTVGEVFRHRKWKIEVLEMDRLRISKVRLTEPPSFDRREQQSHHDESRKS